MGGFEIDMGQHVAQPNCEPNTHYCREPNPQQGSDRSLAQTIGPLRLTGSAFLILSTLGFVPKITINDINDKSKTDTIGKVLASLQAAWMLVQVLARRFNSLPITILEFNTVINAICALLAYLLWWKKPQGVNEPTEIQYPQGAPDDWRALLWVEDICEQVTPAGGWGQPYEPRSRFRKVKGGVGRGEVPAVLRCHVGDTQGGATGSVLWTLHETDSGEGRIIWEVSDDSAPMCIQTLRVHDSTTSTQSSSNRSESSEAFVGDHDCESLLNKGTKVTSFRFSTGSASHIFLNRPQAELLVNLCLGTIPEVGKTGISWSEYSALVRELRVLPSDSPTNIFLKSLRVILSSLWPHRFACREEDLTWKGYAGYHDPWVCYSLLGLISGGVHLGFWNSYFPTRLERYIWRYTACWLMVLYGFWMVWYPLAALVVRVAQRVAKWRLAAVKLAAGATAEATYDRITCADMVIWVVVGICVILLGPLVLVTALVWCYGTIYFVVEGIVSLRSLPVGVYQEVDWTQYLPHF